MLGVAPAPPTMQQPPEFAQDINAAATAPGEDYLGGKPAWVGIVLLPRGQIHGHSIGWWLGNARVPRPPSRTPIPQGLASPSAYQLALGDCQVSQHGVHNAVGHGSCDGQLDFTGSGERGIRASTHSPCMLWGQAPLEDPCWGDGRSAMAPRRAPAAHPGL